MLDHVLLEKHGFSMLDCGKTNAEYVYLDDCVFTGSRLLSDIREWLRNSEIREAALHLVFLAVHEGGRFYATKRLVDMVRDRKIRLQWWVGRSIENRKAYAAQSEVLWPSRVPEDPLVKGYMKALKETGYPFYRREVIPPSKRSIFSSGAGRDLLEQTFLLHGLRLRSFCKDPDPIMRPLGFCRLHEFGFGSMLITYRNCPNNCPLVLWYGNPKLPRSHPLSRWYPLFPRRRENEPELIVVPTPDANLRDKENQAVFEALRKLRKQIAAEKDVPPFVVFHDAALRDMARKRPATLSAFRKVRGVGEKKCDQYGAAFISEIKSYCRKNSVKTDIRSFTEDTPGPSQKRPRTRSTSAEAKRRAFALFAQGLAVSEVARLIGRAPSTTVQYLTTYIDREHICSPIPWVDGNVFRRISDVTQAMGLERIKTIFEALGGNTPYDQIRISVACLRNCLTDKRR